MSATMTAADLTETLRRHYLPDNRPPGGLFAAEVGSACGRRRADALWLPLTRAGGTSLVGHELKVTRTDVLAELADPTKAEPWAQYCGRWWLVVSEPELVEGLEIPEAWGIMAPPSGRRTRSMTIVRPAPKLEPMDPAPGLRRLLAWHFYGATDRVAQVARDLNYYKGRVEKLELQLAEARAQAGGRASPHAARIAGIVHAAEQRARRRSVWELDDAVIVDTLVDAIAVRQATDNARRELERLADSLEEPLAYALKAVRKAGDELA